MISGELPELSWPESPVLEPCRSLCEQCLAFESNLRPSADEVLGEIRQWIDDEHDLQPIEPGICGELSLTLSELRSLKVQPKKIGRTSL